MFNLLSLVLKSGYVQAGIMRPEVIYRALPEAVTEVQQVVLVTLVLLLSNGHQVIGKYPDLTYSPKGLRRWGCNLWRAYLGVKVHPSASSSLLICAHQSIY